VFVYLEAEKVRALVVEIQRRFPGSELLCEVFNSFFLSKAWKPLVDLIMRRGFGFGAGAKYCFGIRESQEMESWRTGIEFLDDWSFFDAPHPRLGWLGWLGRFEFARKTEWTVHYMLN
jgi:hypothetical protein